MKQNRAVACGMLLVVCIFCAPTASAHRDDYLNETVVYLTLARHEIEMEYWFDFGRHTDLDNNFTRHNIATEFGITDKWMVDGRVTALDDQNKDLEFESGRFESRLRFGDENTWPVDVALSLEINSERETDGSTTQGIEPRLILSKDIGEKLNFTGNFSEEIPLDGQPAAFLVAFGNRLNWTELIRLGYELQYNTRTHSGSVIPQVWLALKNDVTFKIGYSARFDQEADNFARAALEIEI